jgi:hypothetical protein
MNLGNAPWRAYRKYQLDGLRGLVESSTDAALVNVLGYRVLYQRFLRERLPRVTRANLHAEGDCRTHESRTGEVPIKDAEAIPRPGSPPETYVPGDRFVCTLDDANVLGPVGPAVTSDGRVIAETVGTPRLADRRIGVAVAKALVGAGPRHTAAVLAGREPEPDARFETATLMLPPWSNYYHWTIECLPRIRLLDMYAADEGEHPDLLVPADRPSWMDETIERIDYDGRVLAWRGDVAHVDRLVVPSFPDPTPEECRWLRERMGATEAAASGDGGERVYVSRADATIRQVANRDVVEPVLDAHGFETYVLSELGVAEQIDLFANAEAVVAPHGAGLTNLVYAEDTAVIELFGDKKIASFARLATMLDHDYTPLDCEQRGVNLVVDPERLDAAIRDSLGN